MYQKLVIKSNEYKDSITLMSLTKKVNDFDAVIESSIGMGTEINKEVIASLGFSADELAKVKTSDLMIALKLNNENELAVVMAKIDELMIAKESDDGSKSYASSKQAISDNKNLNMAVVSIPGNHAFLEVKRCLENNINVMLFSDNMSIEDEVELKKIAVSKKLLMMGPDCGTTIINGVGLCFANKVRSGSIGIVGASGTGIQEACVLIDKHGAGICHAIGTGGRDLSVEVGGMMMLQGMEMMENDDRVKTILLISKPPAKDVAEKILAKVKQSKKKYVVCFLSGDKAMVEASGAVFASTLEEAGLITAGVNLGKVINVDYDGEEALAKTLAKKLKPNQKYLRSLYCGGTLAAEMEVLFGEKFNVYSNVTKIKERKLHDPFTSQEHSIVDLGDDLFTAGKPHPMIDPTIRNKRIIEEASQKDVAIIALDFELGYGSSTDPVGLTVPALQKAMDIAKADNREIIFLCYLLSTENEKQDLQHQKAMLEKLGVCLVNSNAEMARIARTIITEVK